ncbi:MAG: DUF2200 family protein [Balneolaceae bacterium]
MTKHELEFRTEDTESPFTRQCCYMDKLEEELARGKKMVKILREPT